MIHKIYISTIAWFKNRYNVAKIKLNLNIDFKLNNGILKLFKVEFTLNFTLYIALYLWKVTKWLVIISEDSFGVWTVK